MNDVDPATFEELAELPANEPTLIEGLPGHGLVASIAVDQLTQQLDLEHHGNIYADEFPPVVTFEDGMVRDPVRVYGGKNPDVMTLKSDMPLPPNSFEPLSKCVLHDLSEEFDQAIFLAGAPAESEDERGEVTGVATTERMREKLQEANIELASEPGLVGGVTGALVRECFHGDVPSAVLIVKSHPFLPDPGAAQEVIENALEPLVDFDIDTSELEQQAEEIQKRMAQVAEQYQQMVQEQQESQRSEAGMPGMYQ
ncbi:proteasome assembly chaperone family protein [Halanaeroarchaeum sulfurireducens]|uniref:ATP-grasp superfamily enzyme n=1 Tax=Halanaeroarchaeum sulfurireducens TaxID=1604004 RepID=A0A0F7PBM7_9EURY|nr:PAC2 family protein [Halanaeroarchaeum sulfurireducens]AKH97049.1 ATP-grasp superfamily enzyme [Halanaeroarchaeum sulfurireducens]ALG81450.1 ATP-grasp superfamily enzyme [Halanaeroarchaeum sulfurireducens]